MVQKIYDCFPFFNELELLEIRLEELYDTVDKFILTESTLTHSGLNKPLYYLKNKERFAKYNDKIIHKIVDLDPNTYDPWNRERSQRDMALNAIKDIASDNDYIIVSDVDEIPSVSSIKQFISDKTYDVGILKQERCMFYFNYRNIETDEPQSNSRISTYKTAKRIGLTGIRYCDKENIASHYIIPNGGWHFTFMGGKDAVIKKLQSFAHQEYNTPDKLNNIENLINEGKDIYTSKTSWEFIDINNSFPKAIVRNQKHYESIGFIKNNNKIVNIIIPTYNRHIELERCLNSIEQQTYRNIKIWVCADGPDLIVKSIVESFNTKSDLQYNYLALDEHEGVFGSKPRIYALEHIESDSAVCFVDDDNVILPTYVEKLYNGLRNSAQDNVVLSYCVIFHNILNTNIPKNEDNEIHYGNIDSLNVMIDSNIAKLNKDKWQQSIALITHDADFILSCKSHGNVVFINEILGTHYTSFNKQIDRLQEFKPNIFDEIFTTNKYQVENKEIENKTIIDIGAHVGYFTLKCLMQHKPKQIIAYEPNKNNFNTLSELTKEYTNCTLNNLAVFDNSKDFVYITDESEISQVSDDNCYNKIKCITLSSILDNIIDNDIVLKIDCEGSEFEIIYNTPKEYFKKIETIYIKIHDILNINYLNKKNELCEYIKFLGYEEYPYTILSGTWWPDGGFTPDPNSIYKYKKIQTTENLMNTTNDYNSSIIIEDNNKKTIEGDEQNYTVTCSISTRNRYFTSLPLCLFGIINQTRVPDELIIWDDGDHLDLREQPIYQNIFRLLDFKKIKWYVNFGSGEGQIKNHQLTLDTSTCDLIWRLDDDNIPEANVLETLLKHFKQDTSAIAGLVIDPKNNYNPNPNASNKIDDIYRGLNEQWFLPLNAYTIKEVDHLYSSFLFRKSAASHGYELSLSRVGHREETIFTYEMKRAGWKNLITPECITWHLHEDKGGIRDNTKEEMWKHDEEIFSTKLKIWHENIKEDKLIVLDSGIGDHFAFKIAFRTIQELYPNEHFIISCCFPDVFHDVDNITLISIANIPAHRKGEREKQHIYRWMILNNWKTDLVSAYIEMYKTVFPIMKT